MVVGYISAKVAVLFVGLLVGGTILFLSNLNINRKKKNLQTSNCGLTALPLLFYTLYDEALYSLHLVQNYIHLFYDKFH